MKKNLMQPLIGGVLTVLGLILCVVGFTGYTPTEKINGEDPYFPFILWGIFALLIGLAVSSLCGMGITLGAKKKF